MRSLGISNSALFMCLSSARPDLSPKDNVIAQDLAECSPRPYAELIRSDIPGPSSSRSIRSATLRPSPPSAMKVSPIGPSVANPHQGKAFGSGGEVVSEVTEHETENFGLR